MRSVYAIHNDTGRPADALTTDDLCDGDQAAWLRAECGIDTRRPYWPATSRPVQYRSYLSHGAYQASMLRPTRRERIAGWWRAHRWDARQWLARAAWFMFTMGWLLLAYLALNLVLDGANALLDWMGV